MKWIDTHTHIYEEAFDADREDMIRRAKESGIVAALLPNVDTNSIEPLLRLCDEQPEFAFPMMGLHPTSVNASYASQLQIIEATLSKRDYYAIGEIGIDLYWDHTFFKEQKIVFEEQLKWSIDLGLPVSIHCRDAFPEIFDSIYKVGAEKLKGVFHCFTGTPDDLEEIKHLKRFKIGINGVVTFKNSALPDIIKAADPDMLLLETDAPYLAPTPYRGKRNELSYLYETAKKTAEIFGITINELAKRTKKNALELFNISINFTDGEDKQLTNNSF